jgi:hypothetical protein
MNSVKKAFQRAVQRILTPLVRILLHHNISYEEFSHWVRRIYIDVAEKELLLEGRKQTDSRLSVLTGIHRKRIKVLRAEPLIEPDDDFRRNRMAHIIHQWQHDKSFTNHAGKPKQLTWKENNAEFIQLVEQHGSGMPVRAALGELIRAGIIEKTLDGFVKLKKTSYLPLKNEVEMLNVSAKSVTALLETIHYNLQTKEKDRFQKYVEFDNLPSECLADFQHFSNEKSMALLQEFNTWLKQQDRDKNPTVKNTERYQVGVGIYYFEKKGDENC